MINKLVKIAGGVVFLFVLLLGITYSLLPSKLPELDERPRSVRIVDRHGRVIRNVQKKNSPSDIDISHVRPVLIQLLLQAEDKRFYEHNGIDFKATLRSLYLNISQMRIVSGASTITQQVARMAFDYERSFINKVLVVLHALKLERYYTKGKLLESYMNLIPYGHKVTGVKQGARYYFRAPLNELSVSELSTLVVLIRAPSRYASRDHRNELILLRNRLIDRIQLDPSIRELAKKEAWHFKKFRFPSRSPHFVRALLDKHPLDSLDQKVVKTTLDLRLQRELQAILSQKMSQLKDKGATAAGLIVLDNRNGGILAYIGNHDFFSSHGGEYDAIQTPRQPGSTMKPFTYALALEREQYKLSSILPDVELYFKAGIGSFKPRNYSMTFTGPRTVRHALANSLNIPALYLTDTLGTDRVVDYMRDFGFNFDRSHDYYGVGVTLGNTEIPLIQLTNAYMAFANKGTLYKPRFLSNKKKVKSEVPLSTETAELITDVLSDSNARAESFGPQSDLDTIPRSAAKTGTSTLYRDNWVVGYTPRITVGVWIGNMDQSAMKNVSGISGAGPIYKAVINTTSHFYHSPPFEKNKEYERTEICASSGQKSGDSCPHSYTEIFRKGRSPRRDCSHHRMIEVRGCNVQNDTVKLSVTSLPPRYKNWQKSEGPGSVYDQVTRVCKRSSYDLISKTPKSRGFRILSPPSGSIYAIDPDIPGRLQQLHIKTLLPANVKEVRWRQDGKPIHQTGADEKFFWKVQRGRYRLTAEVEYNDGHNEADSIVINVL